MGVKLRKIQPKIGIPIKTVQRHPQFEYQNSKIFPNYSRERTVEYCKKRMENKQNNVNDRIHKEKTSYATPHMRTALSVSVNGSNRAKLDKFAEDNDFDILRKIRESNISNQLAEEKAQRFVNAKSKLRATQEYEITNMLKSSAKVLKDYKLITKRSREIIPSVIENNQIFIRDLARVENVRDLIRLYKNNYSPNYLITPESVRTVHQRYTAHFNHSRVNAIFDAVDELWASTALGDILSKNSTEIENQLVTEQIENYSDLMKKLYRNCK